MINSYKKKNIKIVIIFIIIFSVFLLIKNNTIFRGENTIDYTLNSKENTMGITGEITKDLIINQDIEQLYGNFKSVELQFANFSNRNNKGTVNIKISTENRLLADKNYDVSKIRDGEFVKISFDKILSLNNEGINIKVSSVNSIEGSAVTLWMSEKDNKLKNSGKLMINGKETGKMLNMKLNYTSPKFNYLAWGVIIFLLWIMIPFGVYKKYYNRYNNDETFRNLVKKYYVYIILLAIAFILICLRDLNFLTKPIIYAEDGVYISNIFKNGFIKSAFMTRSGLSGDFQNSGSYVILFLALNLTKIFHGYDLSYLPTYIGIVSNLFLALVALITYIAIKPRDKVIALISYLCVILIPVGADGPEIFGRTLNTVFIWPVFASMLLIILYRQNSNKYFAHIIISLLCLLSCLSFPVTYGIVGIYLCFSFLRMITTKENKLYWILKNGIFFINMIIGVYLLPSLLQSKGVTVDLTMKYDSIIEFVFARHVLYAFIYGVYKYFNNWMTIVMFISYILIVLYALYLQIRKKGILNLYTMIFSFTMVYWIASVGMRIKMTAYFDNYKTSFPDRYFYGCNILFVIVFLCAINIIFEVLYLKKQLVYTCETFIIVIMLINPYLFQLAQPDTMLGEYYNGTFNQCVSNSLKEQNITNYNELINVKSYPNGWIVNLPYIYAKATAETADLK